MDFNASQRSTQGGPNQFSLGHSNSTLDCKFNQTELDCSNMRSLADYLFSSTTQIKSEEEVARQDDPAQVGDKSKSDEGENNRSRDQIHTHEPPPSLTTNRPVDSIEHRIINAASTSDGTIAENRYQSQFSKHHDNNSTFASKEDMEEFKKLL